MIWSFNVVSKALSPVFDRSMLVLFPSCPLLPITNLEENVDEAITDRIYSYMGEKKWEMGSLLRKGSDLLVPT